MKKYLAVAALVGLLSFVSFSVVGARGNHGYGLGMGYGYGDNCGYCNNWSDQIQDKEKAEAFFQESKETRKQLAVKKSERRALMSQDNPNEKRVAELTGEIFDLRNLLDEKAQGVFGDNAPFRNKGPGRGPGDCRQGPRNF